MAGKLKNGNKDHDLTAEDQRAGGIRSGEVRREKATMKAMLEMLLNETNKKSGKTYRELATLGLLKGAINGNAQNYRTILETLGELKQAEEDQGSEGKTKITIVNNLPKDDEE